MTRSTATSRVLLFLVAGAFLASCSDTGPVSVPADITPALSVQDADFTGDHILSVSRGAFSTVSSAIASLGGSIVRSHDEAGIIIATGLSDDAVTTLQDMGGVQTLVADIAIQSGPDPGELRTESMPAGAELAGHDPTTAAFFPVQWDMRIIDADDAWAAGFSGSSAVTVAIIDSGIDPFHQDLVGRVDASRSIAFVPSENPTGPPWGDDRYHGTHVAGIVSTNGIGTSGVAPHTTLIAVKVCNRSGSCPFAAILSGIIHAADNDSDVINMSLGFALGRSFPGGGALNALFAKAMNYAARKGVLVVSAAGNSSADLDHLGRDLGPVAAAVIAAPCESGNGMCIAATGPTDAPAGYTNFGRSAISVSAPGGDFVVTFNPLTSVVLAPCSSLSLIIPFCAGSTTRYLFLQGTSMATPHVAGAAALLDAQSGGALNAAQLKTALQRSADDLGKKGVDPFHGKGRINVFQLVN